MSAVLPAICAFTQEGGAVNSLGVFAGGMYNSCQDDEAYYDQRTHFSVGWAWCSDPPDGCSRKGSAYKLSGSKGLPIE